ncbi:hypothetical protein HKX42_03840 [Salinisphaera sp. USBA-960]|nr:hypothetical protein [Salifodinibacter halophilus]NNC26009.1 hypothetical protein [Salifodinibacter halophilus]
MTEYNIIDSAQFTADDGVQFSGTIDASGHVVIEMDDPDNEVDNRVRLLAGDLGDLTAMLQRFQRASMATNVLKLEQTSAQKCADPKLGAML